MSGKGSGWASAIPLVGGLIQSGINAHQSKKNVNRTIQHQKELAQYAYEKDLEMWQRQNEYNTPEQQMARLANAGLNPNLVYGSGSVAGNQSGEVPKYQRPDTDYTPIQAPQLPDMLAVYQNVKLKDVAIRNAEQDIINKTSENLFTKRKSQHELTKGDLTHQQAMIASRNAELLDHNLEYLKEQQRLRNVNLQKDISKKELDIIWKNNENYWRDQGMTSADHPLFRMLILMLNSAGISPEMLKQ